VRRFIHKNTIVKKSQRVALIKRNLQGERTFDIKGFSG